MCLENTIVLQGTVTSLDSYVMFQYILITLVKLSLIFFTINWHHFVSISISHKLFGKVVMQKILPSYWKSAFGCFSIYIQSGIKKYEHSLVISFWISFYYLFVLSGVHIITQFTVICDLNYLLCTSISRPKIKVLAFFWGTEIECNLIPIKQCHNVFQKWTKNFYLREV